MAISADAVERIRHHYNAHRDEYLKLFKGKIIAIAENFLVVAWGDDLEEVFAMVDRLAADNGRIPAYMLKCVPEGESEAVADLGVDLGAILEVINKEAISNLCKSFYN